MNQHGRSGWAQVGSILLLAIGGLLLFSGVLLILGLEVPNVVGGGVSWIGLPFIAVGLLHIAAGWSAWRRRRGGQVLGISLGVLGALAGLGFLPSVNNAVHPSEAGSAWPAIRWFVVGGIVPYAVVVVGLLIGNRHFQRGSLRGQRGRGSACG
jgi:hypothetical protein